MEGVYFSFLLQMGTPSQIILNCDRFTVAHAPSWLPAYGVSPDIPCLQTFGIVYEANNWILVFVTQTKRLGGWIITNSSQTIQMALPYFPVSSSFNNFGVINFFIMCLRLRSLLIYWIPSYSCVYLSPGTASLHILFYFGSMFGFKIMGFVKQSYLDMETSCQRNRYCSYFHLKQQGLSLVWGSPHHLHPSANSVLQASPAIQHMCLPSFSTVLYYTGHPVYRPFAKQRFMNYQWMWRKHHNYDIDCGTTILTWS